MYRLVLHSVSTSARAQPFKTAEIFFFFFLKKQKHCMDSTTSCGAANARLSNRHSTRTRFAEQQVRRIESRVKSLCVAASRHSGPTIWCLFYRKAWSKCCSARKAIDVGVLCFVLFLYILFFSIFFFFSSFLFIALRVLRPSRSNSSR